MTGPVPEITAFGCGSVSAATPCVNAQLLLKRVTFFGRSFGMAIRGPIRRFSSRKFSSRSDRLDRWWRRWAIDGKRSRQSQRVLGRWDRCRLGELLRITTNPTALSGNRFSAIRTTVPDAHKHWSGRDFRCVGAVPNYTERRSRSVSPSFLSCPFLHHQHAIGRQL